MSEAAIQKVEKVLLAIKDPEFLEAIEANFEDAEDVQFERVKMPSGGGLTFEMLGENGEPAAVADITGIIVGKYKINTRWGELGGESQAPLCVALDAKHGIGDPGGDCRTCPLNQWGSGKDGRGKECKNCYRCYVLPLDKALPKLLTMPPTSMANFKAYLNFLSDQKKPYYAVLTRAKLEKTANKGGITYSRVTLGRVGDIPREHVPAVLDYMKRMGPFMSAKKVEADDYAVGSDEAEADKPQSEPF